MSTTETIPYRFLVRGGTAANLAAVNEVPLKRELVLETDTGRFKTGDGVTSYTALPYVAESPRMGYLSATFEAGDEEITVGTSCDVFVPYGFKPVRATLLADAAGMFAVDARACPLVQYPPDAGDSIFAGSPPALSGTARFQGSGPPGGWSAVAAGSAVRLVVTACVGVKRATLIIEVDRKWQG